MEWQQTYKSKLVTAAEAVKKIQSGNKVFLTGNCSTPQKLLNALIDYAPELRDVTIYHALLIAGSEYVEPRMQGHLRANSLFISANVREAVNAGRADFTPVLLSEFPILFKTGVIPLDVALVHLSPPDENGFCTLGTEAGLTKSAAESARLIIAEVNQRMPRMKGDTLIHVNDIDWIVEADYLVAEAHNKVSGDQEVIDNIGKHIASLIPDGATLQLGIGGIPNAVLHYLKDKKDLGIHSELFSDGLIELVESGVVNGSKKSIHPGKIIAGFIIGSHKLYEWVNHNDMIELYKTEYVNDPFVIAKNDNMVAINSAMEVDFTGQVCADSIGTYLFSGIGGQLDFIYGASRSKGGLPIIALPSTATMKNGEKISKIVPTLKPGAGITVTRNHVHYIATEYGIVDLYGKPIRERTELLISIAHPEFRDELRAQAQKLKYVG